MVDISFSRRFAEPASVQRALTAGMDHAAEPGVNVAIVVVGVDGGPLGLLRHPDAFLTSVSVATAKAFTARNFGRSTAELAERLTPETRQELSRAERSLCFLRGGVAVEWGGTIVAGSGVSGATPEQDEQIALCARDAALSALEAR